MALRVLLADESSTIKKVFQLALQDYAVEVKSVNVGVDVVPVAQKYQPDILFADVLLQKQSGYDVCSEIKRDPQLKNIPVVLMWSGFMELDHDKFEASSADGRLEKPFDVKSLRQLVQNLVPKTQSQDLSQFLQFPKLPEFTDAPAPTEPPRFKPSAPPVEETQSSVNWSMEDFSAQPQVPASIQQDPDEDDFIHVPLSRPTSIENEPQSDPDLLADTSEDQDNSWSQTDLSRYRINLPKDSQQEEIPEIPHLPPEVLLESETALTQLHHTQDKSPPPSFSSVPTEDSDLELELEDVSKESSTSETENDILTLRRLDSARIEEMVKEKVEFILKQQASQLIEEVVWKVVPEVAERVIEREVKKLLENFEPQRYS